MAEMLTESSFANRPNGRWRVSLAAAAVLGVVCGFPEYGLAQAKTVHIRESLGSSSFRANLNAAFAQHRVPLAITSDPSGADYILQSHTAPRNKQKQKRRESAEPPERKRFAVVVTLVDRCGDVAWRETAGEVPALGSSSMYVPRDTRVDSEEIRVDVGMSMGRILDALAKDGSKKLADRMARRLRTAIRRGDVGVSPKSCAEPPS